MPGRVFVRVTSDFDPTGYMQPRAVTWPDGRRFTIEAVRSFRPFGDSGLLSCYTVVIHGQERCLFFERSSGPFSCSPGRWYVNLSE